MKSIRTELPKMRTTAWVFAAVMTAVFAASCAQPKKKPEESTNAPAIGSPAADENTMGDSDSGKAMGLRTVNFPYDSFFLDSAAKTLLKSNAEIMKTNKNLNIQIEGHCDQRGGIQYNIALGEKRAGAAKKYLEDLGVKGNRVATISYGKERPIDNSMTEESYARNRRANFVITSK